MSLFHSDSRQQSIGLPPKILVQSGSEQESVTTNMVLERLRQPNDISASLLRNVKQHRYHWERNAKVIDLRSESVTKPTLSMKAAMMEAELGDDSFREDPTVNALERHVARLLGKEAALFVVSSRMSNIIAIMAHCRKGSEILCGDQSQTGNMKGNISRIYNVQMTLLKNLPDGTMDLQDLENHIRKPNLQEYHEHQEQKQRTRRECSTKLVTIENTHCYCGGKVLPISWIDELSWITKKHDLALHMDGSRLFHASEHLFVPTARIVRGCDSVTICFSSLGAPLGAALAGSESFIIIARHYRKILGGGMHQAGIIAACARVSLDQNVPTLSADHEHAQHIASAIRNLHLSTFTVDPDNPETNIVHIHIDENTTVTSTDLVQRLSKVTQSEDCRTDDGQCITVLGTAKPDLKTLHLVLHYDVSDNDVSLALRKIVHVLQEIENTISV